MSLKRLKDVCTTSLLDSWIW